MIANMTGREILTLSVLAKEIKRKKKKVKGLDNRFPQFSKEGADKVSKAEGIAMEKTTKIEVVRCGLQVRTNFKEGPCRNCEKAKKTDGSISKSN